ncbi:RusA family crossover junction endodeoxyribonuclease [Macrococcus hajekii]
MPITYKDVKGFDKPMNSPRPRFKRVGNSVRTYMPASYMHHKAFIAAQMPRLELTGQIKITLMFGMPVPASTSKVKRERMYGTYHNKKPDIDNLVKTVLDAANKHVWVDDGQIVSLVTEKRYTQHPKILMTVEEIEKGLVE